MPHFQISDFGGITNATEGLIRGFNILKHHVTPLLLEWKEDSQGPRTNRQGDSRSVTGLRMEQRGGYIFPTENRFGYKGNTRRWKRMVKNYDLILWQVPVPTKTAANRGNNEWPELYDVAVPQIAHSHDGNIASTPWMAQVYDRWNGMGCVHTCALHGAEQVIPLPLSLVPSPQWNIDARYSARPHKPTKHSPDPNNPGVLYHGREGWISLQTFKRWKRVDDLVRAVPFLTHAGPRYVAGGGIERYYMTSPDKVKNDYIWKKGDKNFYSDWKEMSIWNVAVDNGMQYLDFIGNEERDGLLGSVKALIDPSWSRTYAGFGAHWNRTVIDALVCGAVPIMHDWGDPTSPLVPGVHFIALPPFGSSPRAYAKVIDDVMAHDWTDWMKNARQILEIFRCEAGAKIFLELAEGRGNSLGVENPDFVRRGEAEFKSFFAG